MKKTMTEWFTHKQAKTKAFDSAVLPRPKTSAALMISLEPRIMFDGAAVSTAATIIEHHVDSHNSADTSVARAQEPVLVAPPTTNSVPAQAISVTEPPSQVDTHTVSNTKPSDNNHPTVDTAASSTPVTEVLVVDTRVPDYQKIVDAAEPNVKVILLDSNKDGVQQIADGLKGLSNIESISIVSHGDEGVLLLGNSPLFSGNLAKYSSELATIGKALTADGDILLYGCHVGEGSDGQAFLSSLATATGADIAASTDNTGGTALGGNWNLEIATGTINYAPALDTSKLLNYDHLLVTTSVNSVATLKAAIATGDTDNVDDVITFTGNITFASTSDTISINVTDGHTMSIVGGGFTLNGNNLAQVLNVSSSGGGSNVTISNLTISNGFITGAGGNRTAGAGGAGGDALGANISNTGTLSITNSTITAGKAAGGGGAGGDNFNGSAAGAGGGGGGFDTTFGGIAGTNFTGGPQAGPAAGTGGRGAGYNNGANFLGGGGGSGGTATGAAGAGSNYGGYSNGGAGGLANNGTIRIGGGGGGSGYDAAGGRGGNAAGGIYNTGTLTITGSTITNNIGTGGGGGGGALSGHGSGSGGNGGTGTGAVWNAGGTVNMDSGSYSSMSTTNAGGSGSGGTGATSGSSGTATSKIYTTSGGTTSTTYIPPASITSATYDASTGTLSVTGTNMTTGDTIDPTKLTLTGQGGGTYTLTSSSTTASSATAFSVTLNAADKLAINGLLNKTGTSAVGGTTYNLAGAANWDSTKSAAADATGNGVTVSNVTAPTITSATYDASTHILSVTGTNMVSTVGATNDITVSKLTLTGEGGTTYTLTSSNVELTSATSFSVTLNATDQAGVETILNKNGTASTGATTYNLAAADDWDSVITGGDISDATNGVTASNVAIPTITSATYNEATGALVVTGTGFSHLNGATNDIVANKFTLTGEGGATYTLTNTPNVEITSNTSFTLMLSVTDEAAINQIINKNGTSSSSGTTYNLAAAEDWAAGADTAVVVADLTSNGITVSNVAVPTITSATYNEATGVLAVTGTGLTGKSGANNDIDVSKLTLTGEGGSTYTLTSGSVEITNGTSFSVTLNATDQAALALILNKNGTSSTGATTYNLAAAEDWAAGADAAVVVADLTGNGVTVSNVAVPTITSSTYDASTGSLVVTGTGFSHLNGATNDIVANKFTFTGEGGSTYTLTNTSNVDVTSSTSFTLALSATDKAAINQIINKTGTSSSSGTTYNLAAAEDWAAGADTAVVVADLTGNGITVSNVAVPTITSATYNEATGALLVTGTGFLSASGAANDIVANKFTLTGEGGATYTLTNTANVDIASGTAFTLTLSATDKAAINQIFNKNGANSTSGTTYNLAAAEDWAAGADAAVVVADLTGNTITTSNVAVPSITSSTYDVSAGTLTVTGTGFLSLSGAANDIVANKFTFTGAGGSTYTLTNTSNVEITSGTSFVITMSATDKAALTAIMNKAGVKALDNTTYNLNAAEDWDAGADAAVVIAASANPITAANLDAPPIVSNLNGDSVTYTEKGSAVLLDSGTAATVTDSDSANFNNGSLTVSITTNGVSAQDVLGISTSGSVSLSAGVTIGSHVSVGGVDIGTISSNGAGADLVIGFNSSATPTRTATLISAITYANSNTTDPNTATRSVSFIVDDGAGGTSTSATVSVAITAINDAPTLSATGGTPTYTENGAAVDLFSGVSVSAVEASQNITQLKLTVSNLADGSSEILRADGTDIALTNGTNGTTATNGMSYSVSVSSGTATVTISKAGGVSSATASTIVDGMSYRNASEAPNTANRVVTLTSIQDNGGTANGGVDTTSLSVAATVAVVSVNDAPSITAPASISVNEDVTTAITGVSFADVDAGSSTVTASFGVASGTLTATSGSGVTVSGSGTGSLTLNGSLANINSFITASNLSFVTASNATSNVTLNVGINDNGNTGTGGSLTASTTVTLAVTAINDAPVNTAPTTQTIHQDTNLVFNSGNGNLISISDVDSGGSTERVTLTVTHGLITLSGTTGLAFSVGSGTGDSTMTFDGTLSDINTALNGLTFTPTSSYNGSASLQITSNDLGNTGAGGAQITTNTVNITVSPLNPSITDVTSTTANGTYKVGDTVAITTTFDQAVTVNTAGGTPTLLLETGTIDHSATYVSGSGTNTLTFNYTVQTGDQSADLDSQSTSALSLNGGTIKNAANDVALLTLPTLGGAHSIAGQKALVIDGVAPSVASVGVPANGTYTNGQTMDFTVTFDEAVNVSGTPQINVLLDSGNLIANYVSGSSTNTLVFRTTVTNGQQDTNGIGLGSSINLNGGNITDLAGNVAHVALNGVAPTSGVFIDSAPPLITSVNVPVANSYKAGDVLTFKVNTNEVVNISGGTPSLTLDIGGSTVSATYAGGSGTNALTFSYTVKAGDNDVDGIGISSLSLNGANVSDNANNPINTALNGVGATNGVIIDTTPPVATSINLNGASTTNSANLTYTLNLSENVTGVDTSDFTLASTGTASGTIASVTQVDGHTYDIQVSNVVGAGTLGLNLNTSGTGIVDTASNAITGGLTGAAYTVDRIAPSITSINLPANGTYVAGQTLTFTVNLSETVVINGTPRLTLTLDNATLNATYVSGSGSNSLTFTATVASGNLDTDGIVVGSSIDLNGGSIKDTAGNNSALSLTGLPASNGILVDAVAPTITGIQLLNSPSTFATNVSYQITFDENVKNVNTGDFTIATTGNASGSIIESHSVDGKNWVVAVGNISGNGDIRLDVKDGSDITDNAGNKLASGVTGATFTAQTLPPVIPPTPPAPPVTHTTDSGSGIVNPPSTPLIVLSNNTVVVGGATNTVLINVEPPSLVTQNNASPIVSNQNLPMPGLVHTSTNLDTSSPGNDPIGVVTATTSLSVKSSSSSSFSVNTGTPSSSGTSLGDGGNGSSFTGGRVSIDRLNLPSDNGLQVTPTVNTVNVVSGAPVYIALPSLPLSISGTVQFTMEARLIDGRPLANWLKFDPVTGTLKGQPPAGFTGKLQIEVIVRDSHGNRSSSVIELNVKSSHPQTSMKDSRHHHHYADLSGKPALQDQFAHHSKQAQQWDSDALLRVLNQLDPLTSATHEA